MAKVIIDQFGCNIKLIKDDDELFEAKVDVVLCNQFFWWIVALEGKVAIKGSERTKERFKGL